MTPEQFTYWLQGFFEISETPTLSAKQVEIIKAHLQTVFTKVTPDFSQIPNTSPIKPLPSDSPTTLPWIDPTQFDPWKHPFDPNRVYCSTDSYCNSGSLTNWTTRIC